MIPVIHINMKFFFPWLTLMLFAQICFSQVNNITIKGKINLDFKPKIIYISGDHLHAEIPISTEGDFSFQGSISQSGVCFIKTDNSYTWSLWVATGEIELSLQQYELDKSDTSGKYLLRIGRIRGPAETEKSQWLLEQNNIIAKQFRKLPTLQFKDSMAKYFDPLLEEYIIAFPKSTFSSYISGLAHKKENRIKFLSLVDKEVSVEENKRMKISIKRDSAIKNGLVIEGFEMKTLEGKLFSLNNLSSEYTLIDFWAHDCFPCRAQHPKLISIYNNYHTKGFEIVSISLDHSKVKWKKAVQKDKITWIQISDLKGWNNAIAKRFFIDVIPYNILIDKNKQIIGSNLSPESISQLLDKLLKN